MCVKPIEKREGKSFISVSKCFSGWQCQVVFIWLLLGFSKCFTYAENSSKEKQKLFLPFFFFFLKKETKLSFRRKVLTFQRKEDVCMWIVCSKAWKPPVATLGGLWAWSSERSRLLYECTLCAQHCSQCSGSVTFMEVLCVCVCIYMRENAMVRWTGVL